MDNSFFPKMVNLFLRPFRQHFIFLIVFFILATSCHIIRHLIMGQVNINAAIVTAMHCLNISYIVTLFIGLIQSKNARQCVQAFIIAIAAISFSLNFYCICQFNYLVDADIAMLIIETDPNEAREFATTLLPKWIILAELAIFLFFCLLWWLSQRRNLNLGNKAAICSIVIVSICIAGNLYRWDVWRDGPFAPFYELSKYDIPSDLKSYYSHPQLTYYEKKDLPQNIVVIIGESFSRTHSSVYGYDKLTNPHLTALRDSSLLFVFDSIVSPAATTAQSIRDLLSTYNLSEVNKNEKKWYEYISLIEIMKDSGYDCYWFGNQACANKHNGTARVFAQACDYHWFFQREGSEETIDRYDIILVDSSFYHVNKANIQGKHNFFIYHMMGSHFNYRMRYPEEYAKFTENDYLKEPKNHREILATYDNSILYNDYVVSKIINLFKDSESVIIYFSDHGQVMYRNKNKPDYYVHGQKDDPTNYDLSIEIPFFIYASPLFQRKYPQIAERLKNRQNNPKYWNSEDLPFFIMDLINVKEINGKPVRPRSIL